MQPIQGNITGKKCGPGEAFAYRINDAAKAIGLSRATLYRLIAEGKLSSVSIAGRRLVTADALHRLVAEARPDETPARRPPARPSKAA